MKDQRQLQEALLQSWMAVEVCIRGTRLLSGLFMNEMLICNILYQRRHGDPVTAAELCSQTKLLKSQMNHILSTIEHQGLICRNLSAADTRQVCVRLQDAAIPRCLQEHERVLEIMCAVPGTLGEEEFLDSVTLDHRTFYHKPTESDVLPTTGQLSLFDFEQAFRKAVEQGDEVLCIAVFFQLPGCFQSACIAAGEFPGKIIAADSRQVAIGERILVQLALRARDFGKSAPEIGALPGIKPVIAVDDGKGAVLGKARGSKNGNNADAAGGTIRRHQL